MATRTVTVSFGEKDAILWGHIENTVGTPVTSSKIRNLYIGVDEHESRIRER
ncbi:MAG: hypothetical protein U9N09_01380 [Euryarchaeota archaeon]|nr:hypothetical protein [Euryarchaeota archaeon]